MIVAKISMDSNEVITDIRMKGSREAIFFETAYLIRNIYNSLMTNDPDAASHFRMFIQASLSSDQFFEVPMGKTESCVLDLSGPAKGGHT